MIVPVSLNSKNKWSTHCFELQNALDGVYGTLRDQSSMYYSISNILLYNDVGAPVYIDELHIGQMRSSKFEIDQLNQPLTVDGQVPTKVQARVRKMNENG